MPTKRQRLLLLREHLMNSLGRLNKLNPTLKPRVKVHRLHQEPLLLDPRRLLLKVLSKKSCLQKGRLRLLSAQSQSRQQITSRLLKVKLQSLLSLRRPNPLVCRLPWTRTSRKLLRPQRSRWLLKSTLVLKSSQLKLWHLCELRRPRHRRLLQARRQASKIAL